MTRPKLLDLFCGAGGASMGYHRAGFDVFGVDIEPMYQYPLDDIIQDDAFAVLADREFIGSFDAIHASPVCKRWTVANRVHGSAGRHPDQIAPLRQLLQGVGLPYVIENVVGSPLRPDLVLCGSMFGLGFGGRILKRHRLFESNVSLDPLPDECRGRPAVGVYGTGGGWTRVAHGGGGVKVSGRDAADALGIDWTTDQRVLSQAIPPAYTEFIGGQLLDHLARAA